MTAELRKKAAAIEENVRLNDAMFARLARVLHVGMTELEVQAKLEACFCEKAGKKISYTGDIVSGERAAAIEGPATDRILKNGDTLILDIQPYAGGWAADTTRTFFFGEPTERMKKAYAKILGAFSAGEAVLKPGTRACDVYRAVNEALAGVPGLCFPHHAGHAVAEFSLVEPRLVAEDETPLSEGMIIALEPGLYGDFGIRVENNYLITEDGFRKLGELTETMEAFVIL